MISTNRLLACLIALVIVASAGRVWILSRYYRAVDLHVSPSNELGNLRQQLFLGSNHRIVFFIAAPDLARPSDETLPPSWKIAWVTLDDASGESAIASIHCTVIVRSVSDELVAVDASSLLPDSIEQALAIITPEWLNNFSTATITDLPSQSLAHNEISVGIWDADAAVYVTAGPDGAPGIAELDDDRNDAVDDVSELGATGSDDFVVAPGQDGYEAAKSGQILSRLISRGAIVDAPPGKPLVISDATEIWLDFDRNHPGQSRQIMLQVH